MLHQMSFWVVVVALPLVLTMGAKQKKKTTNRKHINIFMTALAGQSSQGRTPIHPRDKRDKMAFLLWNSTDKGRFVPGTGHNLSRGGVPFVPGTVPVCPGHRPAQNVYVYWFFSCPRQRGIDKSGAFALFLPCSHRTSVAHIFTIEFWGHAQGRCKRGTKGSHLLGLKSRSLRNDNKISDRFISQEGRR